MAWRDGGRTGAWLAAAGAVLAALAVGLSAYAAHGVADAHARGYLPVVVTNLAGIGRGFYDEAEFLAYTAWVHDEFARRGAPLLATYWCPHHPEFGVGDYRVDCACRKPAPGMLLAAIERFAIDPAASLLVGDSPTDLDAARAAGVRARLLRQEDWGRGLATMLDAAQ